MSETLTVDASVKIGGNEEKLSSLGEVVAWANKELGFWRLQNACFSGQNHSPYDHTIRNIEGLKTSSENLLKGRGSIKDVQQSASSVNIVFDSESIQGKFVERVNKEHGTTAAGAALMTIANPNSSMNKPITPSHMIGVVEGMRFLKGSSDFFAEPDYESINKVVW